VEELARLIADLDQDAAAYSAARSEVEAATGGLRR
jgi:hypothetical protein